MANNHIPVLVDKAVELLNIRPDGVYVDATVGAGGHARLILEKIRSGKLIGVDCDERAIRETRKNLENHEGKLLLVHENFVHLDKILENLRIREVHGILLDLGMSSLQVDDAARGFSFRHDGPLDMRMDVRQPLKASTIVNHYPEERLSKIFKEYGEERNAKKVAKVIARQRAMRSIQTTLELAELVCRVYPRKMRFAKIHPATKVFQALRIAVNREIEILPDALLKSSAFLRRGGRLVVLSFHSLEDRIVKQFIVAKQKEKALKSLVRKPVVPDKKEIEHNPRCRSAKLRAAVKLVS